MADKNQKEKDKEFAKDMTSPRLPETPPGESSKNAFAQNVEDLSEKDIKLGDILTDAILDEETRDPNDD